MRSLYAYLREENKTIRETSTVDHLIVTPEEEAAEFKELEKINAEWNEKCSEIRATRIARQTDKKNELILKRLEERAIKEEEILEEVEKQVRLEKERSKTFINAENLDKAIEFALANPVDPNFAIDPLENIIRGRMTPATNPTKSETAAAAIASS